MHFLNLKKTGADRFRAFYLSKKPDTPGFDRIFVNSENTDRPTSTPECCFRGTPVAPLQDPTAVRVLDFE